MVHKIEYSENRRSENRGFSVQKLLKEIFVKLMVGPWLS